MRHFYTLLLLMISLVGYGQWSGTNINDINDVASPSLNKFIAVSDNGTVFSSANDGVSWTSKKLNTPARLLKISFGDANTGYIIDEYQSIHKTVDAGATWTSKYLLDSAGNYINSPEKIKFFSKDTGYLIANSNYLYVTFDGGTTWKYKKYFSDKVVDLTKSGSSLFFLTDMNSNYPYSFEIYKCDTKINGIAVIYSEPNMSKKATFIGFNKSVGIRVDMDGQVFKSYDMGTSWNLVNNISSNNQLVYLNDTNKLTTVNGPTINFYDTLSKPSSWKYPMLKATGTPQGIVFSTGGTGIIIGTNGLIARTINGAKWSTIYSNTSNATAIYFKDANNGFVGTSNGDIKHTANGSIDWIADTNVMYPVKAFSFVSGIGYAATDYGIQKTINNGTNWSSVEFMYSYTDIYFGSAINGVAGSNPARYTNNGGISWIPTNANIKKFHFISASTGFGIGYDSVYKTVDTGKTWTRLALVKTQYEDVNDIYYTDANIGYICGTSGLIRKTTDGGNTWNTIYAGYNSFNAIFFNGAVGYAVGNNGTIYTTSDAGVKWQDISNNNMGNIYDIAYATSSWFIATDNGVYKLSNAFVNDITPIGYAAGSTATFNLNLGTAWKLTFDTSRIKVTPASDIVPKTITVTTTKNLLNQYDTIEKVQVYATVTGAALTQEVFLGEKSFKHDVFYIPNDTLYMSQGQGGKSVMIRSTAAWNPSTTDSWIKFNKTAFDIFVNTQFTGNQGYNQQYGTLTILSSLGVSRTIKVIYNPNNLYFNVNKKTMKLNYSNVKDSITVSTNMIWTVDNEYSWLKITPMTGTGSTKIYLSAPDNNTNAQRFAVINIYPKYPPFMMPESLMVGGSEQTLLITQDANPNPIQCPHQATILNTTIPTLCMGDSVTLIANSGTGYIYQWFVDGAMVQGGGNSSYICKKPGIYSVSVTNNNCTASSNTVKVEFYPAVAKPVILKQSGEIKPCSGGSIVLATTLAYSSYNWSSGETTATISVTKSDKYSVTVKDINGCSTASDIFEVNASKAATPSICVVTVGPATGKNVVVWKREAGQHIKSYKIYKESTQANVYNEMGTVSFNDFNFLVDENSNPAIRSNRYAVSAIDSCDVESPKSVIHKTLHLTLNQRYGGGVNLIWENYEGLDISSYTILYGDAAGDMKFYAEIPSNILTYSIMDDLKRYYQVAINLPGSCELSSLQKAESGPYSQSLSNITEFKTLASDNENISGVSVFPNPFTGQFTIQYQLTETGDVMIEIYNVLGEKVAEKSFAKQAAGVEQLSLNAQDLNMTPGLYSVKVKAGNELQTLKVIYSK